jgi:hypothetical protein
VPDGWWLLAANPSGESTQLWFLPTEKHPVRPVHVPIATTPDRLFLATAGDDALVTFRSAPFTVWRIDSSGELIDTLQPHVWSAPDGAGERRSKWTALSALSLGDGFVQVLADLTTDARVLLAYDADGDLLSNRTIYAPFGFVAVATEARTLLALQTFVDSELVTYHWQRRR